MPEMPIGAHRPAFAVDGVQRPELAAQLIELAVEDAFVGASECRATFGNWGVGAGGTPGFLFFDREVLDLRRRIAVSVPTATGVNAVFDGTIRALEGGFERSQPPVLVCQAVPLLHKFRTSARSQVFRNLSDADVIRRIAGDSGLAARVDVDGSVQALLGQAGVSDLDFLLQRARALDAELWLDGRTLHVQARRRRAGAAVELAYGAELLEFRGTWGGAKAGSATLGTTPFVAAAGVATCAQPLSAGQRVLIEGVGPLLEGTYYLTRVGYRYDLATGLACTFDAERVVEPG